MTIQYIYEYLPIRYQATEEQNKTRKIIYNFKDGNAHQSTIDTLAVLINQITEDNKAHFVICFVPASTEAKTQRRYSSVSKQLTQKTGVQCVSNAITKIVDSESGYLSGKHPNPAADFTFSSDLFKGKDVILVDDITTRGLTLQTTSDKLIENGASSVNCIAIAKTINPDWPE